MRMGRKETGDIEQRTHQCDSLRRVAEVFVQLDGEPVRGPL